MGNSEVKVYYIKNKERQVSDGLQGQDITNFQTWLENANIGERYCYHRGEYLYAPKLARWIYRAFERGQVTLFQKKAHGIFEYWAERR